MFTRQHYKAVAEIIKNEVDHWERKQPQVQSALNEIVSKLADFFYLDNPRFDRTKFMAACGIDKS